MKLRSFLGGRRPDLLRAGIVHKGGLQPGFAWSDTDDALPEEESRRR
jgi:hypothetical protein